MTDLSDFGEDTDTSDTPSESDTPHPRLDTERPLIINVGAGTKRRAGFIAQDKTTDGESLVSKRDSWEHRVRELDAYAVSTSALTIVEDTPTTHIIIHEQDTGDVYMDSVERWVDAPIVPDQYLESASDVQRYIKCEDFSWYWPDVGDDLYL